MVFEQPGPPPFGGRVVGKAAWREMMQAWIDAVPTYHYRILHAALDKPWALGLTNTVISEFEVTGMSLVVRDPSGEVLQTIEWAAAEGEQTYTVPVKQAGEHQLEVTHIGQKDGQAVQATESASMRGVLT